MKFNTKRLIDKYLQNLTKDTPFVGNSLSKGISDIKHNKKRYICALNEVDIIAKNMKKQVRILDIGTSPFTFLLREMFKNAEIYTIDYTNKFKKNCIQKKINFKRVDLNKQKISFGATKFDIVTFLEVLEHLKIDHKQIMGDIANLLVTNGLCILQTPNKYSPKAQATNIVNFITRNKLSVSSTISSEFTHFKECSLGELLKIINTTKNLRVINKMYPMYFDEIDSALVYRRHIKLFLPLVVVNHFITKNIPFLRRGMQISFQQMD